MIACNSSMSAISTGGKSFSMFQQNEIGWHPIWLAFFWWVETTNKFCPWPNTARCVTSKHGSFSNKDGGRGKPNEGTPNHNECTIKNNSPEMMFFEHSGNMILSWLFPGCFALWMPMNILEAERFWHREPWQPWHARCSWWLDLVSCIRSVASTLGFHQVEKHVSAEDVCFMSSVFCRQRWRHDCRILHCTLW